MTELTSLTKKLLDEHLPVIINEIKSFQYTDWGIENFKRELPGKWILSVAAFSNGCLSGYSVNSNKDGVFHIHLFYVMSKFRNSGIGEKILEECEKLSTSKSMYTIQLKCHKNNIKALNFYFRHNFYILKIDDVDENLYLMEKRLR